MSAVLISLTLVVLAAGDRLLLEHGGFLYDSDAYSDDLPFFVPVAGVRRLVLPYSLDTNDMHFHQGAQRFTTAAHFAEYVIDAFDQLWAVGADTPRMLSVGLYLCMIGRPGRIAGLDRGPGAAPHARPRCGLARPAR